MGKRTDQLGVWVKIRGVTIKEVLVVGVCCGRPDMETDKVFFKQLKTGSDSLGGTGKIILRSVKKASSRIKPQTFIRVKFILLRELLVGIPAKGVQEHLETFGQHSPCTRAVHPPKQEKEQAQQETSLVKQ